MSMASGEKSPLGNLLQSGDVDKAAQMAYAVLSMVDKSEGEINPGDKKSVITDPRYSRSLSCAEVNVVDDLNVLVGRRQNLAIQWQME